MAKPRKVTARSLTSALAYEAFVLAQYRLRHRERTFEWGEKKRFDYLMKKVFEAATRENMNGNMASGKGAKARQDTARPCVKVERGY